MTASLLAVTPAFLPVPVHGPRSDGELTSRVELEARVEVVSAETLDALRGELELGDHASTLPRVVAAAGPVELRGLQSLVEPNVLGRGTLLNDVPFELIERIEVLRGPQGTLYGTDSVSGSVNFVLRKPDPSTGGKEVTVEVGSQCPAQAGDAQFEAVRSATCTAVLPAGGALVFSGIVDDATRAWTASVPGLASSGPLGAFLAGEKFRSGASDLYLVLTDTGGAASDAVDATFSALDVSDFAGLGLGPATGVVAPGLVFGTGELSGSFAARGAGGVLGTPTAVTADGVPTQIVLGADRRIELELTPRVLADGRIAMTFGTKAWLPEAAGGSVLDIVRSTGGAAILEPGESLVLGGLVNDRTLESGVAPSLTGVPLLGGLFKGSDAERAKRNLLVFITPRAVDEDGRAFGAGSAQLTGLPPARYEYELDGYVGALRQGLPSFDWLRTETGGVIAQRPLASFDDEASGTEISVSLAKIIDWSLLGGVRSQVLIDARIIDADTSSREDLLSAGGLGLGIEDPNGSGFFITPGNGDVADVHFDLDYRSHWLGLGVREGFDVGDEWWLDVTTRIRYVGDQYEASMSGVTNSATLDILREDDIDSWLVGPALEGLFSRNLWCCNGYCAADLMFGYGSADATTRVLVGGFPERARDLDESQFVWEAGLRAGLRRERDAFSIGIEAAAHFGDRYPIVEYQEFGPAELDYDSDWRTQVGLNIRFSF